MIIEDELKEYILSKYGSLRDFSNIAQIAPSTLYTILTRGLDSANVGNIIKICKTLNISADALADGEIKPKLDWSKTSLDVKDIVDDTKFKLAHAVTLEGKKVDIEIVESLSDTLDIGYELSKRKSTNKTSIDEEIT